MIIGMGMEGIKYKTESKRLHVEKQLEEKTMKMLNSSYLQVM